MKKQAEEKITGTREEFLKRFQKLTDTRSSWQVWADLMDAWACTLANAFDPNEERKAKREEDYKRDIKNLGGLEIPAELFSIVVMALDRNPDQDFLGGIYMELGLGSHWHGQFFTPWSIAALMATMSLPEDKVKAQIEQNGWVSFNDPACGAGATLIGAVSALKKIGVNFQQTCLFCGNDIDRVAAQMCYIQISLLGCPGWIAITNTLSNPTIGDPLQPIEKPDQEYWYTPFYYSEVWQYRILFRNMDALFGRPKKETHYFTFDFDRKELKYG